VSAPASPAPGRGPEARQEARDPALRRRLRERLLSLGYPAFEETVRELLLRMGYTDVRGAGRRFRRGRTLRGGMDLSATAETGVTRARLLLQAKQYERPVPRRFVDELSGACRRQGAWGGVLVATSRFSRAARLAASQGPSPRIRLLDGDELLSLLISYRIGLREDPAGRLALDTSYFDGLDGGARPLAVRAPAGALPLPAPPAGPGASSEQPEPTEMQWRTHLVLGIASLWLLTPLPGATDGRNAGLMAAAASLGALLPDLDAGRSRIRSLSFLGVRPLEPVAGALNRALGHRGALHSLAGLGTVATASLPLLPSTGWLPLLALWLGFASHLFGDALTPAGVRILFPSERRVHLLPRRLRVPTGSPWEDLLFALFAALSLALLLPFLLSPRP